MPELFDTITVDDASVRTTADGYLVAQARVSRTGIQNYTARELGIADRNPTDVIRVYRPPEEVFSADAMASIAHRPMTSDHPPERVTADNWSRFSIGNSGGEVVRDGSFVSVPLVMMDAAAIREFKAGKRELSVGYTCDLEMVDGVEPGTGLAYDAVQHAIRANHIALCNRARGGDNLRFGDQHREPGHGAPDMNKTITIDGIPVADVSDAAAAVIATLQARVADGAAKVAGLEKIVADHLATISAKDGELAVKDKAIADAAMTPEKLNAAVAARASVIDSAKKFLGADFDAKALTDAEIRKAAVTKHLGDAAATLDEAGIAGAFATLQAISAKDGGEDSIRGVVLDGVGGGSGKSAEAANAARAAMIDSYNPKEADA